MQIKTGITDQIYTEVTEGLNENDKVITSSMVRQAGGVAAQPNNPFSGGRRFR